MTPNSNEAIGLQQSLGCGRSSIHFFLFTRNDPILYQGIGNTTAFFMGRNAFYKSVCNRTLWAVCWLLFIIIYLTQTNIYVESLKEDEAREPKKAKRAKNKPCEQDSLSRT